MSHALILCDPIVFNLLQLQSIQFVLYSTSVIGQKSFGSLKISYETICSEKTFSQFLKYFRQD